MINIFKSPQGRVIYRMIEIFVITGSIGVIDSGEWKTLFPSTIIAVVAGILKAIREYLDTKKKNQSLDIG